MSRTRIKICGFTREADVDEAIEAGADALGFVLYPKSPRALTLTRAEALIARLPPFVTPVLLFVNASPTELRAATEALPQALLQFHGDETPAQCDAAGRPYLRAARMAEGFDLLDFATQFANAQAILLDAHVEGYGGGGAIYLKDIVKGGMKERFAELRGDLAVLAVFAVLAPGPPASRLTSSELNVSAVAIHEMNCTLRPEMRSSASRIAPKLRLLLASVSSSFSRAIFLRFSEYLAYCTFSSSDTMYLSSKLVVSWCNNSKLLLGRWRKVSFCWAMLAPPFPNKERPTQKHPIKSHFVIDTKISEGNLTLFFRIRKREVFGFEGFEAGLVEGGIGIKDCFFKWFA